MPQVTISLTDYKASLLVNGTPGDSARQIAFAEVGHDVLVQLRGLSADSKAGTWRNISANLRAAAHDLTSLGETGKAMGLLQEARRYEAIAAELQAEQKAFGRT